MSSITLFRRPNHFIFILVFGCFMLMSGLESVTAATKVDKYITIQYDADGGKIHGYADSIYQSPETYEQHSVPKYVSKEGYKFKNWVVDSLNGTFIFLNVNAEYKYDTLQKGDEIKMDGFSFNIVYDNLYQSPRKDSIYIRFKAIYETLNSDSRKVQFVNYKEKGYGIIPFDTFLLYRDMNDTIGNIELDYLGMSIKDRVRHYPIEHYAVRNDTMIYLPYDAHKYILKWEFDPGAFDIKNINEYTTNIKPDGTRDTLITYGEKIIAPKLTMKGDTAQFWQWSPSFNGHAYGMRENRSTVKYSAKVIHNDSLFYITQDANSRYQKYVVYYNFYDTSRALSSTDSIVSFAILESTLPFPQMVYEDYITPKLIQRGIQEDIEDNTVTYDYYLKSYNVVWDATLGKFSDNSKTKEVVYTAGQRLKKVSAPINDEYNFIGWRTKKWHPSSVQMDLDMMNMPQVTSFMSFEAVWEIKPKPLCEVIVYHLFEKLNQGGYDTLIWRDSIPADSMYVYPLYDTIGFDMPKLTSDTIKVDALNKNEYKYKRLHYSLQWKQPLQNSNARIIPGAYSIAGTYEYDDTIIAPDDRLISRAGYELQGWEEESSGKRFTGRMPVYDVTYVPVWGQSINTISYKVNFSFRTLSGDLELRYTRFCNAKDGSMVVEQPLSFNNYTTPSPIQHQIRSGADNDITFVYEYNGTYSLSWMWDANDFDLDEDVTPRNSYSVDGTYANGTYLIPPVLKSRSSGASVFNGWVNEETGEAFSGIMPNYNVRYVASKVLKSDIKDKVKYKVRMQFEKLDPNRSSSSNRYLSRNDADIDIVGYFQDTVFYADSGSIITVVGRQFEGFDIQDDNYAGNFSGRFRDRLRMAVDENSVFTFRYLRKDYTLDWDFNMPSDVDAGSFKGILPSANTYTHSDTSVIPIQLIKYGQKLHIPSFKYDELLGYSFYKWEVLPDSLMPAKNTIYKALWKGDPVIDTSHVRYCAGSEANFRLTYMDYVKGVKVHFDDEKINTLFKSVNNTFVDNYDDPVNIDNHKFISLRIPASCSYGDYKFEISYNDNSDNVVKTDSAVVRINFNNDGVLQVNDYALVVNDNLWKTVCDTNLYSRRYSWHFDGGEIRSDNPYISNYYVSTTPLNGNYSCICYIYPKTDTTIITKSFEFCAKTIISPEIGLKQRISVSPTLVVNVTNVQIINPQRVHHTLQIFNLMGQSLKKYTFEGESMRLDMSSFPSGSYLIRVDEESLMVIKE